MGKTSSPPARLSRLLRYDPVTGHFHWLVRTHGHGGMIEVDDVAGSLKDGYINIQLDKVLYRAHRLAWYVMTGDWLPSEQDIDHRNTVRSDNRWKNLRLATRAQNMTNTGVRSDNKSGVRGVSWRADIGKWHARIKVGPKVMLLGNFDTVEEAAAARAKAERVHHAEFSPLNR